MLSTPTPKGANNFGDHCKAKKLGRFSMLMLIISHHGNNKDLIVFEVQELLSGLAWYCYIESK